MRAIEFETKIKNGTIKLPSEYNNFIIKRTRIIVLISELDNSSLIPQRKDLLRVAFKKLQEANPFKNIFNPVQWQNQLKNDWEKRSIR